MKPETINLVKPKSEAYRGTTPGKVTLSPIVQGTERLIEVTFDKWVFRLDAESANKMGIALFGLTENYAEPVPPPQIGDFKSGDLVHRFRNPEQRDDQMVSGGYQGRAWRVCILKKPCLPGHIWLRYAPESYRSHYKQAPVEVLRMFRRA